MSQNLDLENINRILNDKIVFKEQEIDLKDRESLGYDIVALSIEQKNLVSSSVGEIENLVFQIIDEISFKNDIQKFFEAFLQEDATKFFNLYKEAFIQNFISNVNNSVREGGTYSTRKILKNDGKIEIHDTSIRYSSFDDFMKSLNSNKDSYIKYLNNLKNFSVQEILNAKGYNSLDEFTSYFQKYLELKKTPEYIDFFQNKNGASLLEKLDNINVKNLIFNNLGFLVRLTDIKPKNSWDRTIKIELNIHKESKFLLLDKYKIDNFKEFIDSYKINVETELERKYVDTHFYVNPESEEDPDKSDSHQDISRFIRDKVSSTSPHGGSFDKNIVTHYYKKRPGFSYDNGLYHTYYNFIEKEILIPLYNEVLEKYQKPAEVYGIDKINNLSYEFFLRDIKKATESEYNTQRFFWEKNLSNFVNIIHKEFVDKIPEKVYKILKKEIFLELKENKTINIDSILKSVDSQFKNFEDPGSSLELKTEEINSIKQKLLPLFNTIYADNILKFINKDFIYNSINIKEELPKEIKNSLDEKTKFDVRNFLSQDQMVLLALSKRFDGQYTNSPHSYRGALQKIDKMIEKLKNRYTISQIYSTDSILYYLRNINQNSINLFFDNLKKIFIKQLQQEELFLQKKSTSLGIIDELKINNISLKESPIMVDHPFTISGSIFESTNNSLFNIFDSFIDQLYSNFIEITRYFSVFPEEAEVFFNLTDFNQIKNNLIKILNFVNNNNMHKELQSLQDLIGGLKLSKINNRVMHHNSALTELSDQHDDISTKIYRARNQEEEDQAHQEKHELERLREEVIDSTFSGVEFLTNLFKNKNIGTKKEKIEKFLQIARIIHNFTGNQKFFGLLLDSKYLEKCYNKNIFDVFTVIGSSLEYENDAINTLNIIKEKNPRLIPENYLSENIEYCLGNIRKVNTSDDLDSIVDRLVSVNVSENIKRFKFLLSLANDYESTVKWLSVAQPKVEEVFSPNFATDTFRFRVLGDLDPYHFRVGIDTDCCQAIGNAGAAAAIDSFINPKAGVLLLEIKIDSEWNLAAQSYFHVAEVKEDNTTKKAILLDNIEAGRLQGLYQKNNFYPNAYAVLGSFLKNKGFDIVGCGKAYTQVIKESNFDISELTEDPRHFESKEHGAGRYTDFNPSNFLDLLSPKFSFQMPENITSIDSEMSIKSAAILEIYLKKNGNNKAISLFKLSKILNSYGLKKEAIHINGLISKLI